MPELIDIGANLTHESFAADLAQVIARAQAAGVVQIGITGADLAGSRAALALAADLPAVAFTTAGIHPHHSADGPLRPAIAEIAELAQAPAVRAIGETGLDYHRDFAPRSTQRVAFEAQLELAAAVGLPVFLHQRDAHADFLALLSRWRHRLVDAVVHCFTADEEALAAYLDLDCHIGITGWVCDERRGAHLVPLLPRIPAGRLLLETDAPYLLPRTLRPRPRGRRNEPAYLPEVLRVVAAARGEAEAALAAHTTATARRCFRLQPQALSATSAGAV